MPTRAAVYLRISQDPTGQAAGVTRQHEDCLTLVASMGWQLHDTYTDNDISATTGKPRPEYRRMLAAIQAGHVDAIVAWHPDRLYRRLADLEGLIAAIEARDVIMRTVRAGEIDLATPTGRMLARILSATAQAEGEIKADRWRRSWQQARESGKPARTGRRMYGYTLDGQLLPEEAAIARRAAADIAGGVSMYTVLRWLNAEGARTTRGGVWRLAGLRQYLLNPRIAGYSTMRGEIVAEGQWEPILDRDTWETIRALMASRTRGHPPRRSVLNGLLYCGRCSTRMITSGSKGRRTYRCPSQPYTGGCGGVSCYADDIEPIIETMAREQLSDPRVLARVRELRETTGSAELLAEIAGLEQRLTELDDELDTPGVPVARITRAMDRIRARLEALQVQLAAATPAALPDMGSGGVGWPAGLMERRTLVALALGGHRVYLDPARPGARVFEPGRVRVSRPG